MANSVTRDLIIAEAERRGFSVEIIGEGAYFCKVTTPDGRTEIFHGSRPSKTTAHGYVISLDKLLSLQFIESLGYIVPDYMVFDNFDTALAFLRTHKTIVVKPNDGAQSKGVTVGVDSPDKLRLALDVAAEASTSGEVLLQRQVYGKLYRVLVINNKFIAAALRQAAEVQGDGVRTVAELIQDLNEDPRRSTNSKMSVLKKIDVELVSRELGQDTLRNILPKGELLKLTTIESVSMGGEAINVSETVHESWKMAAIKASREAGLFINGLDIICEDISSPMQKNYLPILEMNHMPGLKLHHYPTGGGEPVDVAKALLDELFE